MFCGTLFWNREIFKCCSWWGLKGLMWCYAVLMIKQLVLNNVVWTSFKYLVWIYLLKIQYRWCLRIHGEFLLRTVTDKEIQNILAPSLECSEGLSEASWDCVCLLASEGPVETGKKCNLGFSEENLKYFILFKVFWGPGVGPSVEDLFGARSMDVNLSSSRSPSVDVKSTDKQAPSVF